MFLGALRFSLMITKRKKCASITHIRIGSEQKLAFRCKSSLFQSGKGIFVTLKTTKNKNENDKRVCMIMVGRSAATFMSLSIYLLSLSLSLRPSTIHSIAASLFFFSLVLLSLRLKRHTRINHTHTHCWSSSMSKIRSVVFFFLNESFLSARNRFLLAKLASLACCLFKPTRVKVRIRGLFCVGKKNS
jgi:hypothetical protein